MLSVLFNIVFLLIHCLVIKYWKKCQDLWKMSKTVTLPCGVSCYDFWGVSPEKLDPYWSLHVSGIVGLPGQRRDGWMPKHSASPWGTTEGGGATVAEASWGPAEAGEDQQAEAPLGHPGALRLGSEGDSEVAEEDGISLILNTG